MEMLNNEKIEKAKLAFDFSDVYVDLLNWENSYFYPGKVHMREDQKEMFYELYQEIVKNYEAKPKQLDQLIVLHGHFFRCHKIKSVSTELVAVRKMPVSLFKLEDTGLHQMVKKNLLHNRLRKGGLVFISGTPGNGKTTTCAASIVSRLEKFGGVCITVEDPPEIPMEGEWGEGICFQTEAKEEDGGFAEGLKGAMRSYPSSVDCMMLIGELRDPETAALTLRAAIDGRLVFTTLHADSVVSGLNRIATLAAQEMGMKEAQELLAQSFRLGIHQRLDNDMLKVTCLVDTNATFGNMVKGDYKLLSSELERQALAFKNKNEIEYKNN